MGNIQEGHTPKSNVHHSGPFFQLAFDEPSRHLPSHVRNDLPSNASGVENTRNTDIPASHKKDERSPAQQRSAGFDDGGSVQNNGSVPSAPAARVFHRVEDGEPLGGRDVLNPLGHSSDQRKRSGCHVPGNEGDVDASIQTGSARAYRPQGGHNTSDGTGTTLAPASTDSKNHDATDHRDNEESPGESHNKFTEHQKRSRRYTHVSSSGGVAPSRSSRTPSKACEDPPAVIGHIGTIYHKQDSTGGGSRLRSGHSDTVKSKPPHLSVGSATKASTPQECQSLPLHVKKVSRIDLLKVLTLAKGLPQEKRLKEVLHFVNDANLHISMTKEKIDETPISKFTDKDIALLYQAGQISPIDRESVKGTVTTFTVTEPKLVDNTPQEKRSFLNANNLPAEPKYKNRRRPIHWPRWDNDATTYESEIEFCNLRESLEQTRAGDSATCADLSMSFSQVSFSPEVSLFHCFKDGHGQWWKSEVMLMGASYSCEVMHLITDVLATAKQSPFLAVGEPDGVRKQVHVDNVRYLHRNPFYVQEAMTRFLTNCEFVNATVNMDADIMPHTFGTSFGVVHDYHNNLAALTEKHLRKIAQAREDIKGDLTVRRACEIMGMLFYGSTVLKVKLANYYFPIKWYRRIAHDFERGTRGGQPFGLDSIVSVWPSISKKFDMWLSRLGNNAPTSHEKTDPTITLFCDASKAGCGAVLIDGVCPSYRQYGEALTKDEYSDIWDKNDEAKAISLLETKAAAKAIRYFREHLVGKSVRLYIDNTSLIGALNKTHSKSFALNEELLRLIKEMELTGASFDVQYVPTGRNLADRPSRYARRGPAPPQ